MKFVGVKKCSSLPTATDVLHMYRSNFISLSVYLNGSSVGIASRYGLDCVRGSNSGGGPIFRTCPDRPWRLRSLLYNGCRVIPGVKRPGRGVKQLPHLAPRVKKQ